MPANRDFRIFFLTVQEPLLIRLYFAFGLASIQTYEEKTLAHRLTGLTRIMKNILFCCWNKTQQQKESSPVGDTSKRIAFLPCRMAMAFVCQPLIAGRQK
jgi:hypothetical protein